MSGKHEMPKKRRNNEKMESRNIREGNVKVRKMERPRKEKTGRRGLKIFGRIVLVLVIILVILVGVIAAFITSKLGKMQQVTLDEADLGISSQVEENLSEYRNIALFGVDSRDSNLGKGNRSDCIIIASLNNKTKEVKLISVYRDTYVNVEGHGLDKITHAYSYGEAPLAIKTLNENFDLNITEFATVNFDSVAEAVNALGGVTINVTNEELKYINDYIGETAKVTGLSDQKVTSAGKQTLNGVQAVAYSRIRYTSGGDYKRTERMRTVIEAMIEKFKTKSISEMNQIIDKILPEVYTNITSGDIFSLLPSIASFKVTDSIGWPYETKGITLDRWYGVPVTLESNVKQLHQEAFGESNYVPSDKVKQISNQIIQKTGYTN